ncbi:type II secretion system protein [Mariniplasma anaerobium]|nr:type II secretion system protein [Mariniplasma anaerobium]
MRKHRGITMVELLGAVAIFAIASSVIALTISLIVNANKDIIETSQASTTGTLIIKRIENALNDLNITDYDLISSDEVILYSDSEYVYDETSEEIILVTYNPRLELSILFNTNILIDNEIIDLSQFSLDETSTIEIISDATTSKLVITVVLVSDEGNLYTFKTNLQLVS